MSAEIPVVFVVASITNYSQGMSCGRDASRCVVAHPLKIGPQEPWHAAHLVATTFFASPTPRTGFLTALASAGAFQSL